MALRPQASTSRPRSPRPAKQPEALDPSRSSTIGPNLAYTNYMALSTPLVRRLTLTLALARARTRTRTLTLALNLTLTLTLTLT